MKKHSFFATLSATVELSDNEFNLLLESAQKHYDGTVNSTICVGDHLYGAKGRRNFSEGKDKNVDFTERQLGLALKSLEIQNTDLSIALYVRLIGIVKDMQAKNIEINEDLKVF